MLIAEQHTIYTLHHLTKSIIMCYMNSQNGVTFYVEILLKYASVNNNV